MGNQTSGALQSIIIDQVYLKCGSTKCWIGAGCNNPFEVKPVTALMQYRSQIKAYLSPEPSRILAIWPSTHRQLSLAIPRRPSDDDAVDGLYTGVSITKSQSMPSHVTSALPPDPFPELSRHKMRLYHFQDLDKAGGDDEHRTSTSSETGRTSPSTASSAISSNTSSSAAATDSITQVRRIFFS